MIYPGDIEPIGKVLGAGLVPMSYLAGHAVGHSACSSIAVNLTDFSNGTECDECKNIQYNTTVYHTIYHAIFHS